MYIRKPPGMPIIALAAMVGAVFLIRPAISQEVSDDEIQGSIRITEGDVPQSLAKVSLQEATDAALAVLPGSTVSDGELDEENGFLIYDIEVTQDGEEADVLIDAGNGSVLAVERDDDNDGLFDDDDEDDDDVDNRDDD